MECVVCAYACVEAPTFPPSGAICRRLGVELRVSRVYGHCVMRAVVCCFRTSCTRSSSTSQLLLLWRRVPVYATNYKALIL